MVPKSHHTMLSNIRKAQQKAKKKREKKEHVEEESDEGEDFTAQAGKAERSVTSRHLSASSS